MGKEGAETCMVILEKVQGNKVVAMATYPTLTLKAKTLAFVRGAFYFVSWIVTFRLKGLLK